MSTRDKTDDVLSVVVDQGTAHLLPTLGEEGGRQAIRLPPPRTKGAAAALIRQATRPPISQAALPLLPLTPSGINFDWRRGRLCSSLLI